MRKHGKFLLAIGLIFALNIFCSPIARGQANLPGAKNYKFINGQWFDGKNFRRQLFYSVNGILTRKMPSKIDETIDLAGGFVVPPFADAHCHHFDAPNNVKQQVGMYLRDGVFYAKSQTDVRSGALKVAGKVNRPTSVDVSYAHGALTHTYGHGIEVYEGLALGLFGDPKKFAENIPKIAASRLRENDAYYIIDTAEDLERKWQKILDGKPDFIKIYLLTSEEFEEKRKNIPNIRLGNIGVDPKLVPEIVKRAHSANLRVSAHVDTAFDYRVALAAGVDEMAHLPGYYIDKDDKLEKYLLTEKDARETEQRKVWVIPTPFLPKSIEPAVLTRVEEVVKKNLRLLKDKQVRIAFGSDAYGSTPVEYVNYIASLGVFSNLEMLKIWCERTPQTIFPNRKIGLLKENYEASFIVLSGNPLDNFEQVKNIKLRFKQGYILTP
jgi:imidazolonepropionase-like amidohydrolase